jgi:phosphate-selective porin
LSLLAATASTSGFAQDWDPLLDKLTEKGLLSAQDRDDVRRQRAGKNMLLPFSLKLGGRIQLRFAAQQDDPRVSGSEDSFRVRRARMSAGGTFIEDVDYHLEVDVSRSAALEEANIRILKVAQAHVTLGQFKLPFSMENLTSGKKLDMAERTEVVRALAPDKDIGIMLGGQFFSDRFSYRAAMANGNGKNSQANDNDQFIYVLRLEGTPVQRLALGNQDLTAAVGVDAAYSRDSAARADAIFGVKRALGVSAEGARKLAGTDLAAQLGRFSLKTEYLWGEFKPTLNGKRPIRTDGFYVQGGWYLTQKLQALARHEVFDPDKDVVNDSDIRWTTLGLNYFIRGHDLRTQVNYIFKQERTDCVRDDSLAASIQLLF